MKRLLSLLLSTAMLAALTLPASAAEETADTRLARVTQAVKKTLDLDTDSYETFNGSCSENLAPVWTLGWGRDKSSLSIDALEDGTVVSLYRWDNSFKPSDYRWTFPAFPEIGEEGDQAVAENFLSRVLRPGETVELGEPTNKGGLDSSGAEYSGHILLNGLPSPLNYSIFVENGQVTSFRRDVPETAVIGGVPSPDAPADQAEAAEALSETLKLRLEYVLKDSDSGRAVLRYTPGEAHSYLVDAGTGKLIDLTELEEKLPNGTARSAGAAGDNIAMTSAKDVAADEAGLTEAEQSGVEQMEGVLSREDLDKALRAVTAYGLRGYALVSASYEAYSAEGGGEARVLCSLRYARTENGERLTRTITVDAKTGKADSIWSSAPYGREKKLTEKEALEKAEAFLKSYCPERDLVLYESGSEAMPLRADTRPDWSFTFAQKVNGLPFGGNAVRVGIDSADGSIYSLSSSWDEGVTFDSANGLVSMETALAAWAETYETTLAYRNVPRKLDKSDPIQARLMEQDMEYYYALRLTYGLERAEDYSGVDAKTGEAVREDGMNRTEPLVYTDLSGSAAKADIEKLAQYGVGYAGEKFRPGRNITQWDLVALLYSLRGTAVDPDALDGNERENAYYSAYRMGALRPEDRDDGAVLSRSDVVKLLLDAAGYGSAARLEGVYTCGYSDKGSIPDGELGYASIAQALGMASGTYAGNRSAARGETASMLCRLLERTV